MNLKYDLCINIFVGCSHGYPIERQNRMHYKYTIIIIIIMIITIIILIIIKIIMIVIIIIINWLLVIKSVYTSTSL